jgi:quercetin dioxygenase-like cupin family protein
MNLKRRKPIMTLKRPLVLALTILVITTGVVMAADFVPVRQAGGSWSRHELRDFTRDLKSLRRLDQSSVTIVEVTLNTDTGWHSHPGAPSLLIVESGTMELIERGRRGRCITTTLGPGAVISHPTSTHNLVRAEGSPPVVFTVVYFAPVGAPLLHNDAANACVPMGG